MARINDIEKNKNLFIEYYSKSNDLDELVNTLKNINSITESSEAIDEIKKVIIDKINKLQNKSINDIVNSNPNLKDFEFVETLKDINNKDNYGFRHDTYYLKYDNKMFEIPFEYLDIVKGLLSGVNENAKKEDIFYLIKPYIKELNNIDIKKDSKLDEEDIKREIEQIDDKDSRELFLNNIEDVIKERKKLNEYMKSNDLDNLEIKYGINENGERIYTIGDETFKFYNGKDFEMYKIDSKGNSKVDNVQDDKEFDMINKEYNDSISIDVLNSEENVSYINDIIVKMGNNLELDSKERKFINAFFMACLYSPEQVNQKLDDAYNNFITSAREYNDLDNYRSYLSDEVINGLEEKIKEVIEKNNSNPKVKKLEQNNKYGFVDITLIVCSIILTTLMLLYIFVVK